MPARTSSSTVAEVNAAGGPGPLGAGSLTSAAWRHAHLLQLGGLSDAELRTVLFRARQYAGLLREADRVVRPMIGVEQTGSVGPLEAVSSELRGRVIANLFFEDSTRTRVSFTVAARRLGAEVIDLTSVGSSVSKGETVGDTAANVSAMGVDGLVIRHRSSGACHLVVRTLAVDSEAMPERRRDPGRRICSVINAGDGRHEHPTQGLLDIFTLAESFERLGTFDLSGLTVGIVGDVGSSRVARSDIAGMTALGARVICIGPPALAPRSLTALGCEVSHDLDAVLPELDALNVLRIQFERHEVKPGEAKENQPRAASSNIIASVREYAELYAVNAPRVQRMRPHAIVMHPGPINRGVELTAEVADSRRSMVLRQVTHGVAVRMAVMSLCLNAPVS